ncbi:MAG TPA: hypothetical protein VEB66_14525 [Opitutaceae bacterium]|nr:hypothetical protein [Opitutaceae bacterium]
MSGFHNTQDQMGLFFELVGSPFVDRPLRRFSDEELLGAYDQAFPNRIALLYLTLHRRRGWDPRLEEKYQVLHTREQMTFDVIARLAGHLNAWNPDKYVVFKSIKPYPATPNDTDVVCLGDDRDYEEMYARLLEAGYHFHEWAPQQRTVYDARGEGKVGLGKKGGTYYIDLYTEISTDYFAYMNKRRFKPFVLTKEVNGVPVKLLRPEPELAVVMFHSVFPERTYQLEHFYLPLHTMARPDFEVGTFLRFARDAGVAYAVKTQCALVARLHAQHFGFVPPPIAAVLADLGGNAREVARFERARLTTPYLFSPRTFWTAFALKAREWHCFKSLLRQGVKMLNPRFFMDVMRSIRRRLSEKGIYHLE